MSNETAPATVPALPRAGRGVAVAGLAASMFLVILDSAMVNLAGPAIREGLGLSVPELAIAVNSYLVAFAGLLLLGGRLADVLDGRKVYLTGMVVYIAASVLSALAVSGPMLIAGRIGQGIGAAIVVPAALALVLSLYSSPAERTRVMGIWGAVAGAGSLIGVFLGGTLTDLLGWQAVFLTPIPIGITSAAIVWRTVPSFPGRPGRFDLLGALTITVGISALALGTVSAAEAGWGEPATVVGLTVGLASLAAFVIAEQRSAHPLVPLGVFRNRPVVTASVVMMLIGATLTGVFFFLPLYQQEVLGMSALATGMAQIPLAVMIIVGSVVAPLLAKRIGLARALQVGLAVLLVGLLWLALDQTTSGFSSSLLGAFVLIGTGLGLGSVTATAMAVRDSREGESGLLSGLINAAQQVGGVMGLAVLVGISIGAAGANGDVAFTTAFLGVAALILIALAMSFVPTARTRTETATSGAR